MNWHGSLGRVVIEPILTTQKCLGAIGYIFREAAGDDFFGRGVILVARQEWGSTSVLIDSWNKSVKTDDSSFVVGI